jgi:hypothetical protein
VAAAPLPDPKQLMREVGEHQKQLDKVRENYTYSSETRTDDVDGKGQVKKTELEQREIFFVNGHEIGRLVKKGGKPLEGKEDAKETARVTKLVEKAEKTPAGQTLDSKSITISVSQVLEIVEITNERRIDFRGRPAIVFDFAGRRNAKTHGIAEDLSKKLKGTIWVDERDRQVAHAEISFQDDFRIGGGLLGSISKGSWLSFDQAKMNGEIWLPVGGSGYVQARLLLVKGYRERFTERDWDFKRFRVETGTQRENKPAKK